MNTSIDRRVPVDPFRIPLESLELAGSLLDGFIQMDHNFPSFLDTTRIMIENRVPTVSGHAERDYPNIEDLAGMSQLILHNKYPVPQEVLDRMGYAQCHSMMGLFTEISRAWLTVDSDIYIWTYENGNDIAFFDGLGETIVNVGLVKPKFGVFNPYVKYLLVLSTTVEIVVLGVTFTSTPGGQLSGMEEMQLVPEPVFVIPADGVIMSATGCSSSGRIFLGGKDGCLYEVVYQAESTWFGKRFKKVNLSRSTLSYLVPAFLSSAFYKEDPILQITIDDSRHILYTLTEVGTIDVYHMGESGACMYHITSLYESHMVQLATQHVPYLEPKLFQSIVQLCVVEAWESPYLNLIVVTKSGMRLYFTTSNVSNFSTRPCTLGLLHVRLPPGFSASTMITKPGEVLKAFYQKGTTLLVAAGREDKPDKDVLWCLSTDLFPFRPYFAEKQSLLAIVANVWAIEEAKPRIVYSVLPCPKVSAENEQQALPPAEPPLVVQQHLEPPKKMVILSPQGVEIILKQRPVDLLEQLLCENNGPENKAVKAFFREQRADQACAMSLMLACLMNTQNTQLAEWAKRAFFMYGMEPVLTLEPPPLSLASPQFPTSPGFHPNRMSTPLPGSQHLPAVQLAFSPTSPQSPARPHIPLSPLQPSQFMTPAPYKQSLIGSCPRFPDTSVRMETPVYPQLLQESSLAQQHQQQQQQQQMTPGRPLLQSMELSQAMPQPHIMCPGYSAKHNALYLYLGRILGPIWNLPILQRADPTKKDSLITSVLPREDCVFLLGHLLALKQFLEKNPQYAIVPSVPAPTTPGPRTPGHTGLEATRARAGSVHNIHQEEKQSLDAFKVLVSHICEVIGLWKILCEHQLHVVVGALPDHQTELLAATFKSLILAGHELCSILINSLISRYLNDAASVDAISSRLRDVCPHLYRNEDAACSKANEMLLSARNIQNPREKQTKLQEALELCKNVAPNLNLPLICQWFASSQYYEGILELSIICAARLDPRNIAVHYYNNNQPPGDEEGYKVFVERMQCYKEITSALDQLYDKSITPAYSPTLPSSPGRKVIPETTQSFLTPAEAQDKAKQLIEIALSSSDELLHIAIYEWLMSRNLLGDLTLVDQPTYEKFLKRKAETDTTVYNLLWKYYERNDNHADAAKVLIKLAKMPGSQTSLNERIAYLAHALVCTRSLRAGCAPPLGGMLRDLEDLMEVARLQQQILDAVSAKPETLQTREAIVKLNSCLIDITKLYEDFAEPFQLWTCKLAIIHCSGHNDPSLVDHVWMNIIETELQNCAGFSPNAKMSAVMNKVKQLCEEYGFLPRCVPTVFLVQYLENLCCKLGADAKQVHPPLLQAGLPMTRLLDIYDSLLTQPNLAVFKPGKDFHIHEAIGHLIEIFLNDPKAIPSSDRQLVVTKAQDVLTKALLEVMSKTNAEAVLEFLQGVKARLNRIEKRVL